MEISSLFDYLKNLEEERVINDFHIVEVLGGDVDADIKVLPRREHAQVLTHLPQQVARQRNN